MSTQPVEKELSTELKIKEAARTVFHRKGFAATRTRDIAEEAGINLALLNYYFRSKEKLFEIIMLETLQQFMGSMKSIISDETTSLDEKLHLLVERYIDWLSANPEIPLFILSELRANPAHLLEHLQPQRLIAGSPLIRQYQEAVFAGHIKPLHPVHFIMNLTGMIIFPFVAKPMLMQAGQLSEDAYAGLLAERKKLIPEWVKKIMQPE
jgi:AcrR family transcriptional regulator